jgi:hypothetical protein
MPKTSNKNGSDPASSGPLFIATTLFDLFPAHLLTLLLIGGCCVIPEKQTRLDIAADNDSLAIHFIIL